MDRMGCSLFIPGGSRESLANPRSPHGSERVHNKGHLCNVASFTRPTYWWLSHESRAPDIGKVEELLRRSGPEYQTSSFELGVYWAKLVSQWRPDGHLHAALSS